MYNDQSVSRKIGVATLVFCLAVASLTGYAEDEQQPPEEQDKVPESSENAKTLPVLRAEIEVFGRIEKTPAVTQLGDAL